MSGRANHRRRQRLLSGAGGGGLSMAALFLLSHAGVQNQVMAADTWTNGSGDRLWSNGANWADTSEPSINDDVTFPGTIPPAAGSDTPLLSSGELARSITLNNSYSLMPNISGASLGLTVGNVTVTFNQTAFIGVNLNGVAGLNAAGLFSGMQGVPAGVIILGATNTYSGGTNVLSGTLQVGNGTTSGSITGNVNISNACTLAFNNSDTRTFAGVISGLGMFNKLALNLLVLTGNNTYAGGTTISNGSLQIGNGGTSGAITGPVINNGSLTFNRSNDLTFTGVVSGSGPLLKDGAGTLVLTGDHTYSGFTSITAGTLQLGNGGTTGSIPSANSVTDNSTLAFNRSNDMTFGGVVSGSGGLLKLGGGILALTSDNSYSGGTTISAGTLRLGDATPGGFVAGNVVDNAALAFNNTQNRTFAGVISGSGALTKLGNTILVLTGNDTYSGGTTISGGTLRIANGSTTGAIAGDVVDNAALAFNRSDDITFGGNISGTGRLDKNLINTLTLTGDNTYSGPTSVAQGTLVLTKSFTSGSSLLVLDGTVARLAHSAVTPKNVVLKTPSLITNTTGKLDVTDNKLIVSGGDVAAVTALVKSGFNLGGTLWGGPGITTSLGGDGASNVTALGVIRNDFATVGQPSGPIYTSFGGVPVGVNDVLVAYTFFGDADLNGVVNSNDYFQIDTGFLAHRTGWINGDFDYNGVINSNDYFLIDRAFLGQNSAPPSLVTTAVPEPQIVSAASLVLLGLRRGRRRRGVAGAK